MRPVPLLVEERSGVRRVGEPVTVGLPFPAGLLAAPARLDLRDAAGEPVPLQTATLARWRDGSVKWALLDFQASVEPLSTAVYEVVAASQEPTDDGGPRMVVEESSERIVVDTGSATFVIDSRRFTPFRRILVGGTDILSECGSETRLIDDEGRRYIAEIAHIEVETRGQCRTTVLARGWFRDSTRQRYAEFTGRLGFFRESSIAEIRFTVRNPRAAEHRGGFWDLGDPGSIFIKEMSIAMGVASPGAVHIGWIDEPGALSEDKAQADLEIYQDSSGGENWKSSNHANRHGLVMNTFCGYRVMADGVLRRQGYRASPVVTVRDAERSLTVAVEDFWQNFPKAVAVKTGSVKIGLFPEQYRDVHELQGGEQKSHVVLFHVGAGSGGPAALRWAHDRLVPRATPTWYAETGTVPYLTPTLGQATVSTPLSDADSLVEIAVTGPQSFFARREIIDEYGWRHFGDLYADHEAIGKEGAAALVAHYNNQYDVVHGAAVQYMRSGNRKWFALMRDLARHVIDIDIYHTNQDRPWFNGGMFWHTEHYMGASTCTHRSYSRSNVGNRAPHKCGGGPSSEHNYTSGLLVYHCLTGDPLGREAVQGLAEWVIAMDDGRRRRGGWLDRRCTGFASQTVSRSYHGPGRGCGNSINALLDGYAISGDRRFLLKAEALLRRSIHPRDVISGRSLEDVEHRWSYTVFLQTLGKYLDLKVKAGEIDQTFSYARESLLHYARWMARHEVPYKSVLDRVEIPTETWPAQDIRKANIFAFAAKYAANDEATVFGERADFFFRTCVSDLLSFKTAQLTRPIAILMTNAYMQGSREWRGTGQRFGAPAAFGRPRDFVPQFTEMHKLRAALDRLVGRLRAAVS
jgi:YetA-like protein